MQVALSRRIPENTFERWPQSSTKVLYSAINEVNRREGNHSGKTSKGSICVSCSRLPYLSYQLCYVVLEYQFEALKALQSFKCIKHKYLLQRGKSQNGANTLVAFIHRSIFFHAHFRSCYLTCPSRFPNCLTSRGGHGTPLSLIWFSLKVPVHSAGQTFCLCWVLALVTFYLYFIKSNIYVTLP